MMPEQPSGVRVVPLALLEGLFRALAARSVRCCQWKSNAHLAAAVSGETDLDLLVDRAAAATFDRVAAEHGFKRVEAAPGKDYPGVVNYLGYDEPSGRLVHLHVHYDLVLGQQHVKDYHLPVEDVLLASLDDIRGIPVPSAAFELVILAMRSVLKYRLRDAAKDGLGIRTPGIPRAIRTEAEWLLGRTTLDDVRRTLDGLGPAIPAALVLEIIDRLTTPRRRDVRLLLLREKVRRALRPMQRIPRWRATGKYASALWRKRTQSLGLSEKRRMSPAAGGTTIAFVGSDGAGKSTVVAATSDWLSRRLDVATFYMGIPDPRGAQWALKRFGRAARAAHRRVASATGAESAAARLADAAWRYSLGLRRVAEAKSRLREFRRAQRASERGAVVLFDRYPLPDVAVFGRPMDGPRLEQEISPPRGARVQRLIARERDTYARIEPPRHIVALDVSSAESLRRKPEHDADGIAAKTAAIRRSMSDGSDLAVVDANMPVDRVVAAVRQRVWGWI